MPYNRFEDHRVDNGNADFGQGHPRGLDLRPDLPLNGNGVIGIDLTDIIHTHDVGAARGGNGGGNGGGGGGGGGGTSSFAPYTSGSTDGSGFNITINFIGTWTQEYYDIFVEAANLLSSLIIGDVQDVSVRGSRGRVTTVGDIVIDAELGTIDGLYGILGQAGPTSIRTDSSLPATAIMQFDIADVNAMSLAAFADVVLHEMAHSLGFGSIWDRLGLVTDGEYTGANAVAEYHDMGGTGFIPVELDGGSGTAGSHWDEETFVNELMTGYINDGTNYFTGMSAAAFADLGYDITPNYLALTEPGYVLA